MGKQIGFQDKLHMDCSRLHRRLDLQLICACRDQHRPIDEMRLPSMTALVAARRWHWNTEGPNVYVKNSVTGVFHTVMASTFGGVPILWKARCGWKFGATFFEKVYNGPADAKVLCDKCFVYQGRLDLKSQAAQEFLCELMAS